MHELGGKKAEVIVISRIAIFTLRNVGILMNLPAVEIPLMMNTYCATRKKCSSS